MQSTACTPVSIESMPIISQPSLRQGEIFRHDADFDNSDMSKSWFEALSGLFCCAGGHGHGKATRGPRLIITNQRLLVLPWPQNPERQAEDHAGLRVPLILELPSWISIQLTAITSCTISSSQAGGSGMPWTLHIRTNGEGGAPNSLEVPGLSDAITTVAALKAERKQQISRSRVIAPSSEHSAAEVLDSLEFAPLDLQVGEKIFTEFAQVDPNGVEYIAFEEFTDILRKLSHQNGEAWDTSDSCLQSQFDAIDRSGSGHISRADFLLVYAQGPPRPPKEVQTDDVQKQKGELSDSDGEFNAPKDGELEDLVFSARSSSKQRKVSFGEFLSATARADFQIAARKSQAYRRKTLAAGDSDAIKRLEFMPVGNAAKSMPLQRKTHF